jgi:Terpene cyclase DEP1
MAIGDHVDQVSSIPTSRKFLCAGYGAVAVAALIVTWGPNLAYSPDRFMSDFLNDLKVTPASRSYTGDLLMLALAATIFMVIEARKHDIKHVWLYIVGGVATAMAFTFPLFLMARELRMGASDAPRLRAPDVALLAVVTMLIAGHVFWVDVV